LPKRSTVAERTVPSKPASPAVLPGET